MKVIDLLNKIANGEEVPKIIEFHEQYYTLTNKNRILDYKNNDGIDELFNGDWHLTDCLNDEIEIIEEDKEIKYTTSICGSDNYLCLDSANNIVDKINELVKAVNELKKGK